MGYEEYLAELSKNRPETAPLMGDQTKSVLSKFCLEWGINVNSRA